LLIAVHHLVMDGVSWRIVTGDLDAACTALAAGAPVSFPARTASIKTWAAHLSAYAQSTQAKEAAHYWTQMPPARASLPADMGLTGENLESTTRIVTGSLTARETDDLLRQVPRVYQTHIDEILLAALAQAIRASRGTDAVTVRLEGHGRELPGTDIDLSRTVGWFTSLYPARLDLAGAKTPAQVIKSVKEQLRAIPGKGLPYAIVRYLAPNTEIARQLASAGEPDITFNYLGNLDQGLLASERLSPAGVFCVSQRAGSNRRVSAVEVEACVLDSQLQLRCLSSSNLHRRETLQRFMDLYITSLRELIAHCLSPSAGGYTPSDFELAGLSQGELDDVVAELQRQFE
jgi:non-ribosomal peptide synthase protein (TIGR01720 family)